MGERRYKINVEDNTHCFSCKYYKPLIQTSGSHSYLAECRYKTSRIRKYADKCILYQHREPKDNESKTK